MFKNLVSRNFLISSCSVLSTNDEGRQTRHIKFYYKKGAKKFNRPHKQFFILTKTIIRNKFSGIKGAFMGAFLRLLKRPFQLLGRWFHIPIDTEKTF